jgi:hypothetical protein
MVTTRANNYNGSTNEQSEIIALKNEIDFLNKENTSLVKQLKLIGEEYDSVVDRLRTLERERSNERSHKTKRKSRRNKIAKQNDNIVCHNDQGALHDEINRCNIMILETFFDSEIREVNALNSVENSTQQFVTANEAVSVPPIKRQRSSTKANSPRVIAIGTSLVKELYLQSAGLNGLTYCYPGQYVNFIRSRIPFILQDDDPDVVFLQCGGNDLERFPNHMVIHEYEKLITTISHLSPKTKVILGAVPLRGSDATLHTKIKMFNTYLYNRGRRSNKVEYIYAAPKQLKYYKRDLIHFNQEGSIIFQNNIIREVHFRHSFPRLPVITTT